MILTNSTIQNVSTLSNAPSNALSVYLIFLTNYLARQRVGQVVESTIEQAHVTVVRSESYVFGDVLFWSVMVDDKSEKFRELKEKLGNDVGYLG